MTGAFVPQVSDTIPEILAPRVEAAEAWFNQTTETAGAVFKDTGILDPD